MEDVFVASLMSTPVHTVGPDATLRQAGELMLDHGVGSVVVVDDDDRIEGMLTATDFVRVVAEGDADPGAAVTEWMSTDVSTTTANESIRAVADEIIDHGFHHVPVVDDGRVIGMITTTDMTGYISRRRQPSPS